MASPSKLVLGNDGSDCGDVGLLKNAGVGAFIFPGDIEDFPEASLMVCL